MTHVRLTRPADVPLLPAIEESAGTLFATIPELAFVADHGVTSADEHLELVAHGTSWVAEDAGALVGFLAAENIGDALHIWELAVARAVQGRGHGRSLVDAAFVYARAIGLRAVTLTTFRDVPWNESWYRRLGFETLDPSSLEPRLSAILADEVARGLPRDRRCAMRLVVAA